MWLIKRYLKTNNKHNLFSVVLRLILPKLEWCKDVILTHHLVVTHIPDVLPLIKEKFEDHPVEELAIIEKMQLLTVTQLRELEPILYAIHLSKEIKYEISEPQ